jgi:hypothetical protein
LQYVTYLRTFAERLRDEHIALLLLSVTREAETGYEYDLSMFPLIEAEVHRLGEEGLLRFVELPLRQMQKYARSPEGHHWGPGHHRLVAAAVANALDDLSTATMMESRRNVHVGFSARFEDRIP